MIKSRSEPSPYQTCFTNGSDICVADSGPGTGGAYGFQPHELLEAALATSINMAIRMYADRHRIAVTGVSANVSLAQPAHGDPQFEARIDIDDPITDLERRRLMLAARQCPVARMLRAGISFHNDVRPLLATVAGNPAARLMPTEGCEPAAYMAVPRNREAG
jgi:putative redox protein